MNLRPTLSPLTAKEFDKEVCGICAGCGCSCGYIAYLKDGRLIDLYGHPADPNGMGSFCTKGITYIQQATQNPLRITEPMVREGETFRKISKEGLRRELETALNGRVGIFLSRQCDLKDTLSAIQFGAEVFSDTHYLPFRASTLKPQEWARQRLILSLECEPVFSEVMATRWLVDAFESSAHIISVSSIYATTSAKASERYLLRPPEVVRFLTELADHLEGKRANFLPDVIERLAKSISLIRESLILIGDLLLDYLWKDNVLDALRRIRKRVSVNYSFVGDISPIPMGTTEEFLRRITDFDTVILTGNPFIWAGEEELERANGVKKVYLGVFPNVTAVNSDIVVPAKLFSERGFHIFRNGFGIRELAPKVLEPPKGAMSLWELLGTEVDVPPELEDLPLIEEWEENLDLEEIPEGGVWVVAGRTLVEEMGHWNPWTHAIEREQRVLINPKTAEELGIKDHIELGGVRIRAELNSNIAEGVIYVPDSYEEYQPFDPGIRVGKLLPSPARRAGLYGLK